MRNPPILVLLVGAAFLLRLLFAATQATAPVYLERGGDEYRYLKLGYDLITGRTYTDMGISSAPLYPLGVGVVLRPFLLPQTPAQIAATQAGEELPREILRDTAAPIYILRGWGAVLGAALVWLVYRGAWRLSGDTRAATLAALPVAIAPAFIRAAAVIGTETLYMTLLVGGIVLLLEARERCSSTYLLRPRSAGTRVLRRRSARTRCMALSGALFGLATLTRMPPLLLPPLLAALWLTHSPSRRAAIRPALALLASFAGVLALWALYTTLAWGRPVLVSDSSATAILFRGASGGGDFRETDVQVQEITGAPTSEERALPYDEAAWVLIRKDPFGYLLRRGKALLGAALQPHGTLHFSGPSLRAMLGEWWRAERSWGGLQEIARAPGFGGKAVLWAFHLVALAAGLAGGWQLWRRPQNRPALAIVTLALAYTYGLHFLLEANARYLFPNEPLWWMLAGVGLVRVGEGVRGWWRATAQPRVNSGERTAGD